MGGSLALLLAAHSPHIGAVASFYGGRPLPADDLRRISAPVLAIFGEQDEASRRAPAALDSALNERACRMRSMSTQARHMRLSNDSRSHSYRPEAANDAWARTLAWFDKYLV